MLKRFEVSGYRNFKNRFVLDFSDVRDYQFNKQCIKNKLLNNLIIYGKNAVGKTNFGKAIFDIQNNFGRSLISRGDSNFLNADAEEDYATFKYIFNFNEKEVVYQYKKRKMNSLLFEKFMINGELIFEYNHETKNKKIGNIKMINAETLNWEFTDNQVSIISYIINNVQLGNTEILSTFYRFVQGMRFNQGNTSMRLPILNDIISTIVKNNWIKDFEVFLNEHGVKENLIAIPLPTGDKILCFKHKKPIPFKNNCSSGTAALVKLYNWKKNMDNTTFLYMDEFDAFYHYELSEKIIKSFSELGNCQTVVTSHNTNLLSNKVMRPDCFFILNKDRITSIVNATDRELREGHNLEKLYKSGEFGE